MDIGETKSNEIIGPIMLLLKPVFQSSVHVDYPTVRIMINDYVSLQIIDGRRLI